MEDVFTMKTRKRYDEQFKEDSVQLLISSGRTIKAVAAELGIDRSTFAYWKRGYLKKLDGASIANGATEMKPSEMEKELRTLRRELNYVKEQRDILKKAIGIFSRDGNSPMSS
jgi:transposase